MAYKDAANGSSFLAKTVTFNLNRIIDVNYYPVPEACHPNFRHRPIGIGVQDLADTFMALHMPFDSPLTAISPKNVSLSGQNTSLKTGSQYYLAESSISLSGGYPLA
ncbi:hypothetical protein EDD85DRAFT_989364 [Armillaria nabsnona]|nr:hypothetical protein EDD85DRAFT_989364 [Armillaria nabsnona]